MNDLKRKMIQTLGINLKEDLLTKKIIGAAIEVHKRLGPGLLESTYEACLCYELQLTGLKFERQVPVPIVFIVI